MKRVARRQLWLLLAVIALVAAAWWQVRSDRQAAPGTLLPLKPEQITHVAVESGTAPAEHYVKRGAHWWRIEQTNAERADDRRLDELTRIAAAPVQSWQPAGHFEADKIGLSPPQATLRLDGETLRFGGATAIGRNVYVQAGERIGIVSLRYMPRSAQSQTIQAE